MRKRKWKTVGGRFLQARFVSDIYHFHPPSVGGGIAFGHVPWQKRAVDLGERWRSVPHRSDHWIKCSAQCLAPSRYSINDGLLLPSRATCLGKGQTGKKWLLSSCIGMVTQLLLKCMVLWT